MWEVFSLGKQPYDLYDNSQVVVKVSQGHRLYRPQLASDTVYEVMYRCWHEASAPLGGAGRAPAHPGHWLRHHRKKRFWGGRGGGGGAPATEQVEMALGPCPQVLVIRNQHCRRQQLNNLYQQCSKDFTNINSFIQQETHYE